MPFGKIALLLYLFSFNGVSGIAQSNSPFSTGVLTVIITNFKSDLGQVYVGLFNQQAAFPKLPEKAVRKFFGSISNHKAIVIFDNLPEGEYAISVFHDENSNHKMDTNFLGIPKEGIGASSDAMGHFGPPKYKDAKFIFNHNQQTIVIKIVYL